MRQNIHGIHAFFYHFLRVSFHFQKKRPSVRPFHTIETLKHLSCPAQQHNQNQKRAFIMANVPILNPSIKINSCAIDRR